MKNKHIKKLVKCYNYLASRALPKHLIISDINAGKTLRVLDNCLIGINRGIDYKEDGISDRRIAEYCVNNVYRISCMRPENTSMFKVNHIFGDASVQKFLDAPTGVKYYEGEFLKSLGVTMGDLILHIVDKKNHPHHKFIRTPHEERTKKRALNTPSGYYLCSKSTLMWNPFSESCNSCIFAETKCKQETQRRFPELYRLRIEETEL